MAKQKKYISFKDLVHFTPKQKIATEVADEFDYVLYGGAMGGGKSYWLRWYPIRFLIKLYKEHNLQNITAGLFCEDYPSLTDRHLSKIQFEFPPWLGKYESRINGFRLNKIFGNSLLVFRNLDDPSKYQSAEFALIAIDELTKNKKDVFDFLRTRKRWPGIKRTKFIAGTNPGDIGHNWVRALWLDKIYEPNEREKDQFKFVPALATDNPHLEQTYYNSLEGLPPDMRRAYKDGDWDLFKGQFFTEWRRNIHVRHSFSIPPGFRRFIGIDFGSTAPFAAYWIAIDWDYNYWVYREYYKENETAENNARNVLAMMNPDEQVEMAVADKSIFHKQGYGETIADILRRNGIGQSGTKIPMLEPSVGGRQSRIARAQILRQKLHWDNNTAPKIRFFNTCPNAIRTIPSLIHCERKIEDVDTDGDDHAYDAITYVLQKLEDTKVVKPLTNVEQKLETMRISKQNSIETVLNNKFNQAV